MPAVWRDAKIHLEVFGQQTPIHVRVRSGPARLRDLLPVAAEISQQVTTLAIAHAAATGDTVTCKSGCGACCRHLVPISAIEARRLAELVEAMPPRRRRDVRRRFTDAVQRMEALTLLDPHAPRGRAALLADTTDEPGWDNVSRRYFAARIACPFLEHEACSIYDDRPLVCREYNVVTPAEWCSELGTRTRTIDRPARMSEALVAAGNALAGTRFPGIPLTLALEWSEVHAASLAVQVDGEAMFWTLLEHIE